MGELTQFEPGAHEIALAAMFWLMGFLGMGVLVMWAGRGGSCGLRLQRYRTGRGAFNPADSILHLQTLRGLLEEGHIREAHQSLLRCNNWFFTWRYELPEDFTRHWYRLITEMNRLVTINAWPQDFARKQAQELKAAMLERIAILLAAYASDEAPAESEIGDAHAEPADARPWPVTAPQPVYSRT